MGRNTGTLVEVLEPGGGDTNSEDDGNGGESKESTLWTPFERLSLFAFDAVGQTQGKVSSQEKTDESGGEQGTTRIRFGEVNPTTLESSS